MNAEQIRRFKNWLSKMSIKCPICGENKWTPGEILMSPTFALKGEKQPLPVPEVQLICGRCAYVVHFAAMPIGIVA